MHKKIMEATLSSHQQIRIWSLQQNSLAYRAQFAILLEGNLNIEDLKEALQNVVNRHEILRTIFHRPSGVKFPYQVILNESIVSWQEIMLIDKNYQEQEAKIEEIFQAEGHRSFDFEQGPLLCASLITLSVHKYVLLISLPSLCADRWTLKNLMHEIIHFYSKDRFSEKIADEPLQYADFCEWQNELLQTEDEDVKAGRKYWLKHGISPQQTLTIPFTDTHREQTRFEPHYFTLRTDETTFAKLETTAQSYNTPTAVLLLACWQTLIWRLTQQSDIVIGTIFDCRRYKELQDALGPFAKLLPVRCHFEENFPFSKILSQIHQSFCNAYEWQEYFVWEQNEEIDKFDQKIAFLPISFEFEKQSSKYQFNDISFSLYKQYVCAEQFDVKLSCFHMDCSLITELHYNSSLFSKENIERLAEQFHKLLESAIIHPESTVGELEILTHTERQQLLVEFNNTKSDYPKYKCIHQLFEAQVERTPYEIAVVCDDQQLTYAELNARANQLAYHLQGLGVEPEQLVALFVERSLDTIVGFLGILKAGGAYVPLDPSLPMTRLALILEDIQTQTPVLLTQQHLVRSLPENRLHLVCLDTDWDIIAQESNKNTNSGAVSSNLVYVIFTSGSTGRPKGVAVEHQQLLNYFNGISEKFDFQAGTSYATVSTFAADLGNTAIFPALCTGGTLHVISHERASDPNALAEYFCRHNIDCLKITPNHLKNLATSQCVEQILPRQILVLGGDASNWDLVKKIQALTPDLPILNHYGPTEGTVGILTYQVEKNFSDYRTRTVPLGRPIANTQVYILDRHLHPVPMGVPGELHIAGANLARGYFNRLNLTAEKFIPNPFSNQPGTRLYKTGDLVRYLPDGNIEFLGRIDNQVKIRGFRVELNEVEEVLSQHSAVRKTVVIAREDLSGDKCLVAYMVPKHKNTAKLEGCRLYQLPNDLRIAHQNKHETEYLYKEIFENQTYIKHGIKLLNDSCVFDVGANIGMFTLFISQHCPDARIYAFEPISPIFETLQINAHLYDLNVKLFQCGISDREKIEEFTYYPGQSMMSGIRAYADAQSEMELIKTGILNEQQSNNAEMTTLLEMVDELLVSRFAGETYQCNLRTLSDVIREENIERIDLLKVDVQRAELDVLRGIHANDWEKIQQIVMEVHDIYGEERKGRVEEIVAILERYGFQTVVEQEELLKGTDRYNIYAIRREQRIQAQSENKSKTTDRVTVSESGQLVLSTSKLRSFLKQKLPDYMVPSAFVQLDALPLTPNGKIDIHALPVPDALDRSSEAKFVAPRTSTEKTIADIWAQVLGLERISIHDNFFELGGHSLLAIQVISRLHKQLQVKLPLRSLFEEPTVADLAEFIETIYWNTQKWQITNNTILSDREEIDL